jgi:uncharacterized protein with PIN domain
MKLLCLGAKSGLGMENHSTTQPLNDLTVYMRFAADRTLGKLAKWLRILGYDTFYSRSLSDDRFLELANNNRILLSRNTRIVGKMPSDRLIFVQGNDPKMQLQELIGLLDLKPNPDKFFSRCIVCNGLTEPVEPKDVVGEVPDHIWTGHNRFSECKSCGKIYWPGSHLDRSRSEVMRLLNV